MPDDEEVRGYLTSLSNWGRWGPDDERGTLNFITPGVRSEAAALVRDGRTVSCALDITTGSDAEAERLMLTPAELSGQAVGEGRHRNDGMARAGHWDAVEFAVERIGLRYHGGDITHLDAPSHYAWAGQMYNGIGSDQVTSLNGALRLDVRNAKQGVVTRGVLLDLPLVRGADWIPPGEGIRPDDLERAERQIGISVHSGDAVLLRTGHRHRRRVATEEITNKVEAGWHPSSLPWLHEREVALIGSDGSNDALPSACARLIVPVHVVALTAMGMWLLDNCELERLAQVCRERGRWEFLFFAAPLAFAGTTGSPVNPIAVL